MFKYVRHESVIAAVIILWIAAVMVPILAISGYNVKPVKAEEKQVPVAQVFKRFEEMQMSMIPESVTPEERAKWSLLRDVITCESASHWTVTPVPGFGYDVGVCQINTFYHELPAAYKGYDLFTPSQNMLYCIELFEVYYPAMRNGRGWNPWRATQECWQDRQRIRKEQARL